MICTGTVLRGINNIFTVETESGSIECRIKGKILGGKEEHAPLAPGDVVDIELIGQERKGSILKRHSRRNSFSRWNKKGEKLQITAVNLDLILCLTSVDAPPFRPRFIDRVIAKAEACSITPVVVINKLDLEREKSVTERIRQYKKIGYRVLSCSLLKNRGVNELKRVVTGKRSLLVGQSGVGKSTLINSLIGDATQKTAGISAKYNRGTHTTNYSTLFKLPKGGEIIDSPGIRELLLSDLQPGEIQFYFREFAPYLQLCEFSPCTHTHEPNCRIYQAVEESRIHPDRYQSYLNIMEELTCL